MGREGETTGKWIKKKEKKNIKEIKQKVKRGICSLL